MDTIIEQIRLALLVLLKNNFELIFDALFIILYDYEVVIEFNNKELITQEPVLDKIINVLKTIEKWNTVRNLKMKCTNISQWNILNNAELI